MVGIWLRMLGDVLCDRFRCNSPRSLALLVWFGGRSREGIPSMRKPASREIISASVELCETEVCFLHIQLLGTNVWLPKMHKSPHDVDFESCKIRILKRSEPALLRCCFPLNNIAWIHMCDECERSFATSFSPFCDRTREFVRGT